MAVIEFIFYNRVGIVMVGIIIILIGLLLRQIEDSFKLGSLLGMIGGFWLLSLLMFYVVYSKEFTIMKILEKNQIKKRRVNEI